MPDMVPTVDGDIEVPKDAVAAVALTAQRAMRQLADKGLVVPVIRRASTKGLGVIADELRGVTERARQGCVSQNDLGGGTFTLSNLGMFGIDRFTAIINPPESAILAVGQIKRRVVPDPDGTDAVVVRPMMSLTLSVDHRVLNGAQASLFLADLRRVLEEPGWFAV